jgi:hypothetical protein
MNYLICAKLFLLLITTACICTSRENFKQGDRWEYEYYKNAYFYYGPTPYDHSTDTMVGKITIHLDSIVNRQDSTSWYLNIHDSISVWQRKGAPGGYRFITSTFIIDSAYRQIITTGQSADTTTHWEYSKILAPTNISSDFVSIVRQPDISMSWSQDSCSPVCSTKVTRKTSMGVCATGNGRNYKLQTQEMSKSVISGNSVYGSDDNILKRWSDSVGLCQKIILSSFTGPKSDDPQIPENGSNWERFILVRYNGNTIEMKPADVKVAVPVRMHRQERTVSAYFDLCGRKLKEKSGKISDNRVVVRSYPDGQYHLGCIFQR